jgi:hypothetical protein
MRLCVPTLDDVYGIQDKMPYDGRSKAVFSAPACSSQFFGHFQQQVIKILLGVDMDEKVTSTKQRPLGVLGRTRAFYSATETQGRTLLHFHMLQVAFADCVQRVAWRAGGS